MLKASPTSELTFPMSAGETRAAALGSNPSGRYPGMGLRIVMADMATMPP